MRTGWLAVVLLLAALGLSGCATTRTGGLASGTPSSTRPTSPAAATGAPVDRVLAAISPLGWDCALTRDEPEVAQWWCFPLAAESNVDYRIIVKSLDHVHLRQITVVGGTRGAQANDPGPLVHRVALAVLPATYPGADATNAAQWLAQHPASTASRQALRQEFGTDVWVSWVRDTGVANLTLGIRGPEPPREQRIQWKDFHASDALTWGQHAGLDCTRGRPVDTGTDTFEQIRCNAVPPDGHTITSAQFTMLDKGPQAQDITAAQVVYYRGQSQRAVEVTASLVAALGRPDNATTARDWMTDHADQQTPVAKALFNALLEIDPEYGLKDLVRVKIDPPVL